MSGSLIRDHHRTCFANSSYFPIFRGADISFNLLYHIFLIAVLTFFVFSPDLLVAVFTFFVFSPRPSESEARFRTSADFGYFSCLEAPLSWGYLQMTDPVQSVL